jgi:hypothetical protein
VTLLLEARRRVRPQLLYWLPPLFLLWANLHIQFVYGLFVVGLFVVTSFLQELAKYLGYAQDSLIPTTLPVRTLILIFGACVLATFIGPYSYHLYFVVLSYVRSSFPYNVLKESQALNFRALTDFVMLLLTGLAFFALGYRKNKIDPFLLALLCITSIVGYRALRDSWFICIPAAACVAMALRGKRPEPGQSLLEKTGLAAAVALLVFLYVELLGLNQHNLELALNNVFPVQAIDFLREHHPPGPIYNTFSWGGYIAWAMPEYPVAIDGRTDLYGDDIDYRFIATQRGDVSYVADPFLNQARVILLPTEVPLASALVSDSRFALVYRDSVAVAFVRR